MADSLTRPEATHKQPTAPGSGARRGYSEVRRRSARHLLPGLHSRGGCARRGRVHAAGRGRHADGDGVRRGAHLRGHYNPAVTTAVLLRGRVGIRDAVGYWVARMAAGVVAAVVARTVVEHHQASTLAPTGHALVAAGLVELIYTFGLCYVVLNVATSRDQQGNGFYGLAIGFTSPRAPSRSAASRAAPSTRRSRWAAPSAACSPGPRCGSTYWSSSSPASAPGTRSWPSAAPTADPPCGALDQSGAATAARSSCA
jgi:hypothetical protein